MTKQPKVFILGLDGATWAIMNNMIADDKLSNIRSLVQRGAYGSLQSTLPPLSPSAWTSFMTGVDPSRHGIYDFFKHRFEDYKVEIFNSSYIQAETFWNIAGREGKKSIIMDVPMTFPPEEINGIMIAGELGRPPKAKSYTFPHGIQKELKKNIGSYLYVTETRDITNQTDKYIKLCESVIQNRFEAARYLMTNYDWDLLTLVITATDRIQHFFWKYIDEKHPQYSGKESKKYSQTICNVYEQADEILGRIISLIGQDVTTVILSDHGFGPLYKAFRLNEWLARHDYLKTHLEYHRKIKRSVMQEKIKRKVQHLFGIDKSGIFRTHKKKSGLNLIPEVILNRTRAYSIGANGNIYINLRGRQSAGIVQPDIEYESLRDELILALKEIVDPDTGQKIFQNVQKREDVYSGPFLQDMPDILLSWTPGYQQLHEPEIQRLNIEINRNDLFVTGHKWSGTHTSEGIFIMNGQGIKKKFLFNGATIADIAPTVLHLLGLKVPEYMDGHVLTGLMDSDFLRANPVKFSQDEQSAITAVRKEEEYSEEESLQIRERLKDLGYME